jgi:hypothetical protein
MIKKKGYRSGAKSGSWKGDSVGYQGVHIWLTKNYGKADYCENSPDHKTKKFHWANISGEYKRDRNDFVKLCISCHKKFDLLKKRGNYCKNGHEMTEINTWIRKNGWRVCRTCRDVYVKKNKSTQEVPYL